MLFRLSIRDSNCLTLLLSTGLTFGMISALFGLKNGYISQEQYSVLVGVVIGSAVVPILSAQAFFKPKIEPPVALEIGPPLGPARPSPGVDGAPEMRNEEGQDNKCSVVPVAEARMEATDYPAGA